MNKNLVCEFPGSVGSKSPGVSSGSDAFQTLVHVAASAETLSTAQEKGMQFIQGFFFFGGGFIFDKILFIDFDPNV